MDSRNNKDKKKNMQTSLGYIEIDAYGTSNTDDEEESEYAIIEHHFMLQYDLEHMSEQKESSKKTTASSQSQKKHTTTTSQSSSSTESFSDASSLSSSDFNLKILFVLQQDFLFEYIAIKKVYLVRPRASPNIELALKIVKDSQCERSSYIPIELRILSHIRDQDQSGYLQRLEGFIRNSHGYAFLSPYISTNLKDICKLRNMSENPKEIKNLMYQLLCAIKSLHDLRVIHRDVKHSNILWQNDKLVLIDYDNATWDSPMRKHFTTLGTVGYMAPEILSFERDLQDKPCYYDAKIDIYSAGVVFGALLFSVPESDVSEIYVRVMRQKASTLLADPYAADLLLHMIEIDPSRRPDANTLLTHIYFH